MNKLHNKKMTFSDYRSTHDFFIDPETGDICDILSKEIILRDAERREDSPPLTHPRTRQIFHPWNGEILNLTPEQALSLQAEEEFYRTYQQQLEHRQKNRIKGTSDNRTSQHDFFIHPISGDVYDLYSLEIAVTSTERSAERSPIVHPRTGQIYDSWTGQALNLSPRQIMLLKNDVDSSDNFRREREERRRKEEQHEHDE